MSKITEIFDSLKHYGPTFYGSNDEQAMDIAKEWAEDFTAAEADSWMSAGFWCPSTAASVRDMDIEPDQVAALCNDIITGHQDPVYSMCNGDLKVDALVEK